MIFGRSKKSVTNELTEEQKKMRAEARRDIYVRLSNKKLSEVAVDILDIVDHLKLIAGDKAFNLNEERIVAIYRAAKAIATMNEYIYKILRESGGYKD